MPPTPLPPSRARPRRRRRATIGRDEIVCLLCHKVFRAIGFTHLRYVHGFMGDHPIDDYKRMFSLSSAWSLETRRLLRAASIANAERRGSRWTKARVAREIRALARHGSLIPSQVDERLYQAAGRRFGSWRAALTALGIDPQAHLIAGRWDAEQVVEVILQRHARGESLTAKHTKAAAMSLYGAAVKHCGSWGDALRRAGLDPNVHREPMKWSVAGARRWLRDRLRAKQSILARDVPRGMCNRVLRDTGMRWPAFVESTGRRYPATKNAHWTPAPEHPGAR